MSECLDFHKMQHILRGLRSNGFWPVLSDRVGYAGDNFARYTGDTITMAQTQRESQRNLLKHTCSLIKSPLSNMVVLTLCQ